MVSLYADDALLYLQQPALILILSLPEELQTFGKASGLYINRGKSLLFPLAGLEGVPIERLRWESDRF